MSCTKALVTQARSICFLISASEARLNFGPDPDVGCACKSKVRRSRPITLAMAPHFNCELKILWWNTNHLIGHARGILRAEFIAAFTEECRPQSDSALKSCLYNIEEADLYWSQLRTIL